MARRRLGYDDLALSGGATSGSELNDRTAARWNSQDSTPRTRSPGRFVVPAHYRQRMARRRLDPDAALEIALSGNATRHMQEGTPADEAVAELRLLAKGRADLLAVAAGRMLGGWLAQPGMHHPGTVHAVGLLVTAGADPVLMLTWVDETRDAESKRKW